MGRQKNRVVDQVEVPAVRSGPPIYANKVRPTFVQTLSDDYRLSRVDNIIIVEKRVGTVWTEQSYFRSVKNLNKALARLGLKQTAL